MDVVIKDAATIAEFKARKAAMEAYAIRCYEAHQAAFETWTDGDPVKALCSWDGSFIVEYASGRWWHYRETSSGEVEWY